MQPQLSFSLQSKHRTHIRRALLPMDQVQNLRPQCERLGVVRHPATTSMLMAVTRRQEPGLRLLGSTLQFPFF